MSDDGMELIHGSGNVFRDLGLPNPEVEQLKAILVCRSTASGRPKSDIRRTVPRF
jgi:hypothetical protein